MNQERINVKGYGFLCFTKNVGNNLSYKYGQKLHDSGKKSTTDAIRNIIKMRLDLMMSVLEIISLK